jgi:repressor LexA
VILMGKYFDKDVFAKRLLDLIKSNNDTIYTLAEHLHLSPATISRYTTGQLSPKIPTIQSIAEKYNVNPAWLMGTEGAEKYTTWRVNCKKLPVIGAIAAGTPIFAQENIEGYEYVPDNFHADFCLRVKGDSMINARILDGDIVYIRKQPDVNNGEIAAVLIDNEEATLKRVYKLNGTIILRAENPKYKDIIITKKDSKDVKILGKAVFFKSEVR